jgi:hypothetical protein
VVELMKELSAQCARYSYRRIRIFLGRDGHRMSPGRTTGYGGRQTCKCHASGRHEHGRKRHVGRTRCSCSIIAATSSTAAFASACVIESLAPGAHARRPDERRYNGPEFVSKAVERVVLAWLYKRRLQFSEMNHDLSKAVSAWRSTVSASNGLSGIGLERRP